MKTVETSSSPAFYSARFFRKQTNNSSLLRLLCSLPQADWRYSKWVPRAQLSVPWDFLAGCTAGQQHYPAVLELSNAYDNPVRKFKVHLGNLYYNFLGSRASASASDITPSIFVFLRPPAFPDGLSLPRVQVLTSPAPHCVSPQLHRPTTTTETDVWLLQSLWFS